VTDHGERRDLPPALRDRAVTLLEKLRSQTPRPSAPRIMTYEEIREALHAADRAGDCVPENINLAAQQIANMQRRPYHVVVIDENGAVIDPSSKE